MPSPDDKFLRRLLHPRWIPHISDFCDRRCERCAFRARCFSYNEAARRLGNSEDDRCDEDDVPEYESKVPRRQSWIERHPEVFEAFNKEPSAEETRDLEKRLDRLNTDATVILATSYAVDVLKVASLMLRNLDSSGNAAAIAAAVTDVTALAGSIGAKIYRAISSSYLDYDLSQVGDHPVQNDANGSAKIALLMIEESKAAWNIITGTPSVLDRGLTRDLMARLEAIERDMRRRYPNAMSFVRPGFDEEIPGIVRPWAVEGDDCEDDFEED